MGVTKANQVEINGLNRYITSKESETVIENFLNEKAQTSTDLEQNSSRIPEELQAILPNFFKKIETPKRF